MSSLDLFIVNLAFPYIGREYPGTGLGTLSWVLNGYTIVFAAVLGPAGRWADRGGRGTGSRNRRKPGGNQLAVGVLDQPPGRTGRRAARDPGGAREQG